MSVDGLASPLGDFWEIDHSWDVISADGAKVGDVADVNGSYITVAKGFIFKSDVYVPVSAIHAVEGEQVILNVTKDLFDEQGWDQVPTDDAFMIDDATAPSAIDRDAEVKRNQETLRVPVVSEELTIDKREVERGRVHVRKEVVAERQVVDAPLREEEIYVRRRPVDGTQAEDVPAEAFQDIDIEIPIRGEEAHVSKRPVVREQVEIHKRVRQRNERVVDTVLREDVQVHESGPDAADRDRRPLGE
jgi:uncharacterized protein (TIGR02271 family)